MLPEKNNKRYFKFPIDICVAPLAGISDKAFRLIAKEFGASLVFTEMISCKALEFNNRKTLRMIETFAEEHPVAVQIFGSEPDIMSRGAKIAVKAGADIIDINMGCPMPKIVNNDEGAALMKQPEHAGDIVKAVKDAIAVPVSVKMRTGWDASSINAVEFALQMQQAGADMVIVHGRTRDQMYHGKADWNIIREVHDALNIPVVGNGDIFTAADAVEKHAASGVDGLMLARGVLGNPWLVSEVAAAFAGGEISCPDITEKIKMAKKHLWLMSSYEPERQTVLQMRKHLTWYIKGIHDSALVRNEINCCNTIDGLIKILDNVAIF